MHRLEQAFTLYRGEFCASMESGSGQFYDWVHEKREEYRVNALAAFEALAAAYERRGSYLKALETAQRLLQYDPLDESCHRHVMRALWQKGAPMAALEHYRQWHATCIAEFGEEPDEKTIALYHQIQTAPHQPPANARRAAAAQRILALPAQPNQLVGREQEAIEIAGMLLDPECRLLTLLGPGGIGKTSLAREIALNPNLDVLDGVIFVSLAAVSTPDLLVSVIAEALKLALVADQDPTAQLLAHLAELELLLVLDNMDQLIAGATLLSAIVETAPGVKILVTSRERLQLRLEWCFEVKGLAVPPIGGDSDLEHYGAVKLFAQCASRFPNFSLREQARGVVRICRLVAGMPLAIELAAAQTWAFHCDTIAGRIEHNLSFLATNNRDVMERHRSVRAAFAYSWQLLSADEQRLFRALTVFHGSFDAAAAEQVADGTPAQLIALRNKSLLFMTASGWYVLHELLRQYAREQLQDLPEEAEQLAARHAAYYLRLLNQQEVYIGTGRQQVAGCQPSASGHHAAVARQMHNRRRGRGA
jgi:predicted ATPase